MDRDTRDEGAEPDPNEELLRLARGLRGHVKRRKRLGGALPGEVGTDAAAARPTPPPARTPTPPTTTTGRPAAAAGSPPTPSTPPIRPSAPLPSAKPGSARSAAPDPVADARPTVAAGPARSAADVAAQAASARDLDEVRRGVAQCTACGLCATRTNTVFLDGNGSSGLMFVGEAPGAEEDRTGVPFVGRAGQLLTDIVTKGMGLGRQDVWIANVLKCRPPENRDPTPEEKAICTPWLDRQIELLAPRILVPLGRHASMHVLGITAAMNAMRGRVHTVGGRPVVPTFHPAYLLRNPADKKECWKDIQLAMQTAGIPVPKRDSGPGTPP